MSLRRVSWLAEYGSSLMFDAGDAGEPSESVDMTVERDTWAPVTPRGEIPAVQIVDGVRRPEESVIDDSEEGRLVFGLFGSFAVGAVRCEGGTATILDEHIEVHRRYLHNGLGTPEGMLFTAGAPVSFAIVREPDATDFPSLVASLNQLMLRAETHLAETLSLDESAITLIDGRLRGRPRGRRTAGYVKRLHQLYVGREILDLAPGMAVGERTPLFQLGQPSGGGWDTAIGGGQPRYSWYLRTAQLGEAYHTMTGVVRLEAPGELSLDDAVKLADETALALPRLASTPMRDPRAPQNLTPVGALEARLTHRLGDRRWVRRLITRDLARDAAPRLTRTAATL